MGPLPITRILRMSSRLGMGQGLCGGYGLLLGQMGGRGGDAPLLDREHVSDVLLERNAAVVPSHADVAQDQHRGIADGAQLERLEGHVGEARVEIAPVAGKVVPPPVLAPLHSAHESRLPAEVLADQLVVVLQQGVRASPLQDLQRPAHEGEVLLRAHAARVSRKRSNRCRASWGPGPASGWYWTVEAGTSLSTRPSTVRS